MSATQPAPGASHDERGTPAGRAVPDDLASSTAPMPTKRTVRMRTSLPVQAVRFAVVNLKMLRMVLKSHN
jgi:hypothetical protein